MELMVLPPVQKISRKPRQAGYDDRLAITARLPEKRTVAKQNGPSDLHLRQTGKL
jgi:hypothetical protein